MNGKGPASFKQLPKAMKTEIHRHIDLHNHSNILFDPLMCILGDDEKKKSGLFG